MATNYWRGTTDNEFRTHTNWSLGVDPTLNDDVAFDASSPNPSTINIGPGCSCRSFNTTGAPGSVTLTGTDAWQANGSITINSDDTVSGFTGTLTHQVSGLIARSITSAGKTWGCDIIINASGSDAGHIWKPNDNLTTTKSITFQSPTGGGVLDLNGKTLTCASFSSSNTNSRTLTSGASGAKIIVTGVTGTVWNMATTTNLTISNQSNFSIEIGNGTLTQTGDVTFAGGGMTFGALTIKKHAGNYNCIITGGNTFGTFTLETPDSTYQYAGVKLTASTTTTVTSIVAEGTADYKITIQSATAATHTISDSAGTNTVKHCTITNSITTGGAVFKSLGRDGNTDGGGNSGWIFSLFNIMVGSALKIGLDSKIFVNGWKKVASAKIFVGGAWKSV